MFLFIQINSCRRTFMIYPGVTPTEGTDWESSIALEDNRTGSPKVDWRARIRPKKKGEDWAYGLQSGTGSILQPLKDRGGIVFPYTPSLFLQATVDYNEATQHGSNYPFYTYLNSRPTTLPVQSTWTANTTEEAQYLLAVFHFLRSVTKSFYGDSAVEQGYYGTPPPVMLFEYLGQFGFNKVPVVIRSYSFSLPDNVDYVPVQVGTGKNATVTYMPTETEIMIEMAPQYTYKKLRKRFDLEEFTSGKSYNRGFI